MKLSDIAKLINGSMKGSDIEITGISDLDHQEIGTIAYAINNRNLKELINSPVSAIIIDNVLECKEKPVIIVEDPRLAFNKVLETFNPFPPLKPKIYENTYIAVSAKLGKDVTIMPFSSIFHNSSIGDNTMIYPNVYIGRNVEIGTNCIIRSGVRIDDGSILGDRVIINQNSVIGGDGFGYIQKDGKNIKIPQIGKVIIEDDVELGCGVMIDKATIGATIIGKGTKIDNLVQIAHNVKIGANSIVIAQTGIAGSASLGNNCMIAGQVAINDHAQIGDNVIIMAQAGLADRKVESGKILLGSPARDYMETKRIFAAEAKLPELLKRVDEIEKKLKSNEKTDSQ